MPEDQQTRVTPAVPDHQLIRIIGQRSDGDVWLAVNAIGAWRAVKVVYRDRFAEERPYEREFTGIKKYEPISRSNEGLVDILQVGRNDPAGYFYYVMELADDAGVEGWKTGKQEDLAATATSDPTAPLQIANRKSQIGNPEDSYTPRTLAVELQRRGRLPFDECLQLGLSLSLALGHLHRHGLIHWDIKPSNVIFVSGVPKLADMGLVTDIGEARSFVGTEGFIPPEGPNSRQADLYSLGKVLYEISMGKDRKDFPEPFTRVEETDEAEPLMELNAVIVKACAIQPRDRYQSAEELHVDLALLQGGQSIRKKRVLERRLRLATKVGTAAALLAALACGGYFYQQHRAFLAQQQTEKEITLQKIADEQTHRAESSEKESRERLVRMHVATGVRHMEQRDLLSALPWLVEALKTDQGNPDREAMHRTRVAAVLRQLPKLSQVWFHNATVTEFQFSPDGRRVLLFDDEDRAIRICDAATGEPIFAPLRHPAPVRYAFFSPDGQYIAAVVTDDTARVWSALSGEPAMPPLTHEAKVNFATFSRDSQRVATMGEDATARIWRLASDQAAVVLQHPKAVNHAEFSPDGQWLATAGNDGEVRLWETKTGELRPNLLKDPSAEAIRFTHFSQDGRRLLTVAGSRALLWNLATNPPPAPQVFSTGLWVFGALFSPDGQRLLTWGRDSAARVWEAQTGVPTLPPLKHEHGVQKAEFSLDGQYILTVSGDFSLRVWDALTGELAAPPLSHRSGAVSYVNQFSPESRRIITCRTGIARLWDLATSEALCAIDDAGFVKRAVFTKNGRFLLTITAENAIQVWDPATGKEQLDGLPNLEEELPIPFDANLTPTNPAFVPDGSRLQVFLQSPEAARELVIQRNAAFIRDPKTGQPLTPHFRHRETITSATFSLDGRRVATTSVDATARVWDARTGEPLTPPLEHLSPVYHAAFRPDGHLLATVTHSAPSVRVWNVAPDARPLDDLVALSQLLSGSDLDANGGLQPKEESAGSSNHWQRLRTAYPADFDSTIQQKAAWHFVQALGLLRAIPPEEAIQHLDPAKGPEQFGKQAMFDAAIGRWAQAVTNFTKALHVYPRDHNLWHRRGLASLRMNRLTNALDDFSKAAEIEPKRVMSWYHRGLIALALNQPGEALEHLSKAIELQPASAAYWERRGRAFAAMTNWDRALADFSRAQRLVAGPDANESAGHQPLRFLVPPRGPRAKPNQLDLTPYYNATLTPLSPHSPWPTLSLPSLPSGLATLGGVEFDVRGIVLLSSVETVNRGGSFPARAFGIPLRRSCRALHFLHSALFTDKPGNLVGKYVIHYADTQKQEQLLLYGEQLSDCQQPCRVPLKSSAVVWSLNREDDAQTVFVTAWQNPRPGTEIAMLDFVSVNNFAAPFLIAITTEP